MIGGCGKLLHMPKKPQAKKDAGLEEVWSRLHGLKLKPKVAALIKGSSDSDRLERLGARPATENSFGWSVTEAQDSNRLSLWTAFVNLVPARMLDNGDIAFIHVDSDSEATPIVVWDHERDCPTWVAGDRLSKLDAVEIDSPPMQPLSDEAEAALQYANRSAYIVEILARGEFDLNRYLGYDHAQMNISEDLFRNIQVFPPTALYALWHLYFSKQDAALKKALTAAAKSEAQLIRDCATLIKQVMSGQVAIGNIPDISKIRDEAAVLIKNPATRKRAQASELRSRVNAQLAQVEGPIALTKRAATKAPKTKKQPPLGLGQVLDLGSSHSLSLVQTKRPPVTDLVLFASTPSGERRATSAIRIQDPGMPPTTRHEPEFYGWGKNHVVLWRNADPKSPMFPFDGQVSVFGVAHGRIDEITSFALDLARVDSIAERIIVTATDGTQYVLQGNDKKGASDAGSEKLELPGKSVPEPKGADAPSQEVKLDGDTLVLSTSGLKAMRGKKVLWKEPMKEAYEMVVLPGRRQVAVYSADSDHRPQVDVIFIRKVKGPVEQGEGCCSWAAIPCDGAVIEMRAKGDDLYIGTGGTWTKIDEKLLSEPPKWLVVRKWL